MSRLATVKEEDAIKAKKGVYILGRDIREIPCLRSSFLLGITFGTFAGLISFMTTSKVALSSHIGFASLWVAVFGYWIPCRYKYEVTKSIKVHDYKEILNARSAEMEGTPVVAQEKEEEKKE